MTIEEHDFRLVPIGIAEYHYDLYLLKTIRPKGCASREEMTLVAYGCTLKSAILRIASYRLQTKYPEEALSMKEYLSEYGKLVDELSLRCKELPRDKEVEDSNT